MEEVTLKSFHKSLQESFTLLLNTMNARFDELSAKFDKTFDKTEVGIDKNNLMLPEQSDTLNDVVEHHITTERLEYLEVQQVINEVASSVSENQLTTIDLEHTNCECQINNGTLSFEVNVFNTPAEYEEYEEIIFNSEFTSEVVTENINILSENSYLEEKNLSQILSVINYYNYHYIKHSSFFKVIYYYYYEYYYGSTYVGSYIKGDFIVDNLIKFILRRRVFDPGTIYYYLYWNASVKWF